jgi:hypothetical protein
LNGWVWGGAVTFSGDATGIPYYEAPSTPTVTAKAATSVVSTDTPEPEATSTPEP